MAVPEGYTEVGLIGLVNKGNYDPLTEYSKYNFVYYQGSTYLYINELPQSGVTPSDDRVTWQYMSRGMLMDNTPTQGSPNAVTSGGIYDSERALKTEIQNEQTAATTKATDTNNVLGQGTVTNATNVQALLDNVTDKDTNPTKDSAKTVTSGGVYSADNQIRENIANVEGATSAHPYTVGKQLIFNGLLCKATSAISVGDTLAVGTNLTLSDNVVEQIYSLNQGLTNSLANISHENLLDNPWFTVNQRGQSSYSSVTFTVDRWRNNDTHCITSVNADGTVTISGSNGNAYFGQRLEKNVTEKLLGKKLTISAIVNDEIVSAHGQMPNVLPSSDTLIIGHSESAFSFRLTIMADGMTRVDFLVQEGDSITIRAVKLELGSVSTLAMDTAPNYQQELAKCQRYFQRYKQSRTDVIGIGVVRTASTIRFLFELATPMRADPIVTPSDTVGDYTNTGLTIGRIGTNIKLGDGSVAKVHLNATAASDIFTVGDAKMISVTSDNFYIDFSADLQ
jgi:hypothetical protein